MQASTKNEPVGDVVPLKVNAFELMRLSNTQLAPLFPYMHAGSIIPCTAIFENEPGSYMGYFVHENSVDEVALVLASNGQMRSGEMWCGQRRHGVGYDAPIPFYMTIVITQRQKEDGEQPETMIVQCEKCNEEIVHLDYTGAVDESLVYPPLPTTAGALAGVMQLEDNPEQRVCKNCGHTSRSFPVPVWGWDRYMQNTRIVEKGFNALKEAVS